MLRLVGQVVVVGVVAWGLLTLWNNLISGLRDSGISTDFDFLSEQTGFRVADTDFDPSSSAWKLYGLGIKNTLLSASVGIVIASVVGTVIGIARLSPNWLASKLAGLFVESLRNIPPLVVIIFFNFAVFLTLPPIREAPQLHLPGTSGNWLVYSNSTWTLPSLVNDERAALFWILALAAVGVAAGLWMWRTRVERDTGTPSHRLAIAVVTITGAILLQLVLLDPLDVSYPELSGNVVNGGIAFTTAYAAVTIALGLYTASHVAEIIRGSILAVPRGQVEASEALAMSGFQRYRFVILPQALRIAIPPIINQYLNLTKNTSLAIAVAFPELTNLTKSLIGNGAPAPQSIVVLMACYLTFSLVISLVVNVLNRRLQLVER